MRFQEIITKLPKILSADTRFPKEIEIYSSNNISDVAPEDSYTYKETFEPKLLESITSLINTGDITTNDSKDDVLSKLVTVKSLHDISNISGFHLKLKIISWTDKLSDIGNDTLKGIYGETSDTSGPVPSVRFDLIIGDLCIFKDDIKNSEEWVLTSFGEKLQDENDGAPDVCACNYPEEYQKWEVRRKLGLGGSDFEANFDFKNPQCYNSQCANYGIKDTSQTLNCPDLEICNQSVNFFSIDSETNEAIRS